MFQDMAPVLFLLSFLSPPSSDRLFVFLLQRECRRFPPQAECRLWIGRADAHLKWIDKRVALFPADRDALLEYRKQVEEWRSLWADLSCLQTRPNWSYEWRYLARIREAIGEENYRRGYVPPPIAPWFLEN